MITTELPYSKELSAIGDMSIEDMTHERLMLKVDACDPSLDELYDSVEQVEYLWNVRDSIMLKGVTPALVEDTKDYLWDTHEFDITAFLPSSNEQLSYCVESLRTIINTVLLKIKSIINSIIEWFTTSSLTRAWFNTMVFYKRQIEDLYIQYNKIKTAIVPSEYERLIFTGYDYTNFTNLMDAYVEVAKNLNCLEALTNNSYDKKYYDYYYGQIQEALEKCGFVIGPRASIYSTGVIPYRRDTVGATGWSRDKVFYAKDDLEKKVVERGLDINKLKYQFVRNAIKWTKSIDQLISQNVPPDDPKVQEMQDLKNACTQFKTITRFMIRYGSNLCAQWCHMMRMMDDAVLTKTNKRTL